MYYIVQENTFREENYDNLIKALDRLGLEYEIVKVLPFTDDIEFKTKRKDVFPFGSLKLSRVSKKFDWYPGSLITDNHNYLVYKDYYKENLLNYDSKIYKFGEDFDWDGSFFSRPVLDSKTYTGKLFSNIDDWKEFREYHLTNGHETSLNKDTEIQVCSPKEIQQEFRFWIVNGKVVTGSMYKQGSTVIYSELVDEGAVEFCKEMIKLFELAPAYVMDICLVNNEYKIVEVGGINHAGFYRSDLQKLIISLEDAFN